MTPRFPTPADPLLKPPAPGWRAAWALAVFTTVVLGTAQAATTAAAAPPDSAEPATPAAPKDAPPAKSLLDGATYAERAAVFLKHCATAKHAQTLNAKHGMASCVSRLLTGVDTPQALQQFTASATATFAAARTGKSPLDPFDKHALLHTWLLARDKVSFPPEAVASLRDYIALWKHKKWVGYGALNYRLMNDGSGYLAAEQWPALVDADGLDADQIKAATRDRLFGYFDEIVHRNTHEYAAPTYYGVDLAAMKMLADFALDPEMKKRASLTLDWMLLNVACAWNQGYHTAPAGRAKYWGSTNTSPDSMDATAAIGWLYFGGARPVNGAGMNDGGSLWFVAGDYHPPALLAEIARDRATAFTHRGSVLFGRDEQARFTIWHTPVFTLASQWENISSPNAGLYKETRRALLKWLSPSPGSTFTVLQENPQRPYRLADGKRNAFGYGENPFGQDLQCEGTLIGVFNVPENYPHYRLYAPFSREGAILKRVERDGWYFCHGGTVLFGFRPLQPCKWGKSEQNCDVLYGDARTGGWIVETGATTAYAGGGVDAELDRFAAAVAAKTRIDASSLTDPAPRLRYTALSGHTLDLTYRPHGKPYADQNKIDGQPVDYRAFPLLGNPWVEQAVGGDALTVRHGGQSLVYDFKAWTRSN